MKHRILFVGTSVNGGGAERVFINIINSLDLSKYEIKVFYTCTFEKCNINPQIPITFADKSHMRQALKQLCELIRELILESILVLLLRLLKYMKRALKESYCIIFIRYFTEKWI